MVFMIGSLKSMFTTQPQERNAPGVKDYQGAVEVVDAPNVQGILQARGDRDTQQLFLHLGDIGLLASPSDGDRQHLANLEARVTRRESRFSKEFPDVSDEARRLAIDMKAQELANQRLNLTPSVEGEGTEMRSTSADDDVVVFADLTHRDAIFSDKGLEGDLAAFRTGGVLAN